VYLASTGLESPNINRLTSSDKPRVPLPLIYNLRLWALPLRAWPSRSSR
jgi:hypothetical protein